MTDETRIAKRSWIDDDEFDPTPMWIHEFSPVHDEKRGLWYFALLDPFLTPRQIMSSGTTSYVQMPATLAASDAGTIPQPAAPAAAARGKYPAGGSGSGFTHWVETDHQFARDASNKASGQCKFCKVDITDVNCTIKCYGPYTQVEVNVGPVAGGIPQRRGAIRAREEDAGAAAAAASAAQQ